jgi:hypothetical protein
MSDDSPTAPTSGGRARWAGGPSRKRPRESERRTLKGTGGLGSLRLVETTVLILIVLFLAVATVDDLVRQTHVNHRLVADLATWRTVTGHDYRNLSISQDVKGHSTRDTVCGNVSPGGPKERTQLCVTLVGPTIGGRRAISGGFYLPPMSENESAKRYACFGAPATEGLCGLSSPPPGSPPAPPLRVGLP